MHFYPFPQGQKIFGEHLGERGGGGGTFSSFISNFQISQLNGPNFAQ